MSFFAHGEVSYKIFVVDVNMINETLSQKIHPYAIFTG